MGFFLVGYLAGVFAAGVFADAVYFIGRFADFLYKAIYRYQLPYRISEFYNIIYGRNVPYFLSLPACQRRGTRAAT